MPTGVEGALHLVQRFARECTTEYSSCCAVAAVQLLLVVVAVRCVFRLFIRLRHHTTNQQLISSKPCVCADVKGQTGVGCVCEATSVCGGPMCMQHQHSFRVVLGVWCGVAAAKPTCLAASEAGRWAGFVLPLQVGSLAPATFSSAYCYGAVCHSAAQAYAPCISCACGTVVCTAHYRARERGKVAIAYPG